MLMMRSVHVHHRTGNKKEIQKPNKTGDRGLNHKVTTLTQEAKLVRPKAVTASTSGQKGEEKKPCPCQGGRRMQRHPVRSHN